MAGSPRLGTAQERSELDESLNLACPTAHVTGRLLAGIRSTGPIGSARGANARTGGMRESDLEFLPRPEGHDRYLTDSIAIRIKDLQVEIIDRPLSALAPILSTVYLDLNRLIYKGSDLRPGPYMPKHLETATSLVVARRDGQIVGYAMVSHLMIGDDLVLLHNATVVDHDARGFGLTFLLNAIHYMRAFIASRLKPYYSVARTQNPLVYGAMLSTGPYFPRMDMPPPPDVRRIGMAVAEALDPTAPFEADVMVQRNAWKKPSGGVAPRHRRTEVNAYCDRYLDYARGDGLIVVGRFTLRVMAWVAWRYLWKQVAPHFRRPKRPPDGSGASS